MKKPLFNDDGRLIPSFNYELVLEAVDKAVTAAGRDGVAKSIGYSYEQLRRITEPKPNPDEVRHLRLDKFMEITEATGDVRGVEAVCFAFGLRPVPITPSGKKIYSCDDLMLVVLQTSADAGRLAQLARDAAADSHLSLDERKLLRERIMDNVRFLSAAAMALGEPGDSVSPVGYITGQVMTPAGWKQQLVPNEEVERRQ